MKKQDQVAQEGQIDGVGIGSQANAPAFSRPIRARYDAPGRFEVDRCHRSATVPTCCAFDRMIACCYRIGMSRTPSGSHRSTSNLAKTGLPAAALEQAVTFVY